MDKTLLLYDHLAQDDDCIDMNVISSTIASNCHYYTTVSTQHSKDFEFQMSEDIACPADELFYKGKLLPLYIPPDSCNASDRLSVEDVYHYYCFKGSAGIEKSKQKKSWLKKLMLMKSSSLVHKLKASRDYFRSMFSKAKYSKESSALLRVRRCSKSRINVGCKNTFDDFKRKSFSGAINCLSTLKSSSALFSSCSLFSSPFSSASSNTVYEPQTLQRSDSISSEVESSIQSAIAYCKKSQQLISARKSTCDVGFYSLSAPQILAAWENQEIPDVCRG